MSEQNKTRNHVQMQKSNSFIADDGEPVVDVVFLCCYQSGESIVGDPGEVDSVRWMTKGC